MDNHLILKNSSSDSCKLSQEAAKKSAYLIKIFDNFENEKEHDLGEITKLTLERCCDYLNHFAGKEPSKIPRPLTSNSLKPFVTIYELELISTLSIDDIFDLLNASNMLEIRCLSDLCSAQIASIINSNSIKDIADILSIDVEFPEDESNDEVYYVPLGK